MRILFEAKILNIESLHLALTAIGVVIPILITLIGLNKSRKKDLYKALKGKASIDYVDKQDQNVRNEVNVQYVQIQTDLTIIKSHLINKDK